VSSAGDGLPNWEKRSFADNRPLLDSSRRKDGATCLVVTMAGGDPST